MEEEPGSSGKSLIDHYRRHVLQGFTLNAVRATGSKLARAGPFASQAEAGNVRLVRGPWVSAFLDECETFPDGPHDDQVDAVAGAVLVLGGSAYRSKAQKRRLAVGMIGYMQRRAPDCPGCGMPVYMPPMSEVGECQYCGRTYVRGEDEARPVTAATGGC
jgi:ribosomal protein L37AE/L43A